MNEQDNFYKELDLIYNMEAYNIFNKNRIHYKVNDHTIVLPGSKQLLIDNRYSELRKLLYNGSMNELQLKELVLICTLNNASLRFEDVFDDDDDYITDKLIKITEGKMREFKYAVVYIIIKEFHLTQLIRGNQNFINKILEFTYIDWRAVDFTNNDIRELLKRIKDEHKESAILSLSCLITDEIIRYKLFPNYKINLRNINFIRYGYDNLRDYNDYVKPIMLDELNLLSEALAYSDNRKTFSSIFLNSATLIFKLGNLTNNITDSDYDILATMLDESKLVDYVNYYPYRINPDVYDNFKKLARSYMKIITSNTSSSIIKNRVNKILFLPDEAITFSGKVDKYRFGYVLKQEMLRYEGSKLLDQFVVDYSL